MSLPLQHGGGWFELKFTTGPASEKNPPVLPPRSPGQYRGRTEKAQTVMGPAAPKSGHRAVIIESPSFALGFSLLKLCDGKFVEFLLPWKTAGSFGGRRALRR